MAEFKKMTYRMIDALLRSDIETMTPRLIDFLEAVRETRMIREIIGEVNLLLNIVSCYEIQNKKLLLLMKRTRSSIRELYERGFFEEKTLDHERFTIFSGNIRDVYGRLEPK